MVSTIRDTLRAGGASAALKNLADVVGLTPAAQRPSRRPSPSPETRRLGSYDQACDNELIARFKQGDTEAFSHLFMRHRALVYRVTFRMTGNDTEAEDLTQTVFERAFANLGRYRPGALLTTWLYRVAVNTTLDHLKSARRRYEQSIDLHRFDEFESGRPGPEEAVLACDRRQLLERAVLALPEKYRTVVVLRDIEDRPYQEVAEILRLPLTTVKMRAIRARERLAAHVARASAPPRGRNGSTEHST